MDVDLLKYRILDPNQHSVWLWEAYKCWYDTWRDAFTELGKPAPLYSDDFTRQHEVGAIFYGMECIALSFFRWVDLSVETARRDSYFQAWDAADMDQLCREGDEICVSSSFTVGRAWRRLDAFSVKDVLVSLIIERFKLSIADAVCGTVRNNKSVDKLIYRNGFTPIRHNATMHGCDVDLAAFYRSGVRTPTTPVNEQVIQHLWSTHV